MTTTKGPLLVALGGSLRERSYSRSALRVALEIGAQQGAQTELLDLNALDLPLFRPDQPIPAYPAVHHSAIVRLLDACRRADVLLWASPTYHGTVSGAFKNALDFLELLSDEEPPYLQGKAIGLIAVSDPTTFAAMGASVYELRAWLAPTQVSLAGRDFRDDLTLANDRAYRRLVRLVEELLDFARRRA